MCLIITESWKNDLKVFLQDKEEVIYCYKVITKDDWPIFFPYWQYKKGINHSGRHDLFVNADEELGGEVYQGIHCYLRLEDCCGYQEQVTKIIKVKVNIKDIIAVGMFSTKNSLVAMQIYWDGRHLGAIRRR